MCQEAGKYTHNRKKDQSIEMNPEMITLTHKNVIYWSILNIYVSTMRKIEDIKYSCATFRGKKYLKWKKIIGWD